MDYTTACTTVQAVIYISTVHLSYINT